MTSDEYVVNELLEAKKQVEWLERQNEKYAKALQEFRELINFLSPERLSTGTIYFKNDTVSEGDPGHDLLDAMIPKGEE